jgi:polysaccharide biosynthesis protein VpsM
MKRRSLAVAVSLLSLASFAALAQTGPVQPAYKIPDRDEKKDDDGPRSIPLGEGLSLSPYFNVSYGRDNNLFLTGTNTRSSNIGIYNPGLRLNGESEAVRFSLGLDARAGRYSSSSDDNYNSYRVDASGDFVVSSSMGLKLGAEYARATDPRGSTDRGVSGRPDEHRTSGPSALFAYGGNDAKGRIEVQAGTSAKRYLNNRASTIGSDRDTDNLAGRFFVRIAPKTKAIFEVRRDKFDYKLGSSTQDSSETRTLVGLTWEATAATSGTVKVGRLKKDFSAAGRRDFSGTSWEGQVEWKPLSYSKFDLFTSKGASESTGLGDYIVNKKYGAVWTHGWNSRLSSTVSLNRADDAFSGNPRTDQTDSIGLKLNYKVMRWLTVGAEYTNTKRDSNINVSDYTKNLYMLTLGATL